MEAEEREQLIKDLQVELLLAAGELVLVVAGELVLLVETEVLEIVQETEALE
jgi:hypothetical protein